MRKPAIPALHGGSANDRAVLASLKENIEQITGLRGGSIAPLTSDADLGTVVAKVNEIIDRLMNT